MRPHPVQYRSLLETALREDLGEGYDVTTAIFEDSEVQAKFKLVSRQRGVVAGAFLIPEFSGLVDPRIHCEMFVEDGALLDPGTVLARLEGPLPSLLLLERSLLNLVAHLSGIATMTRRFVEAVEGTGTTIADTRKTLPGLRCLQKYAVRVGGGKNHRLGLHDMVLIKDNHLAYLPDLPSAVRTLRSRIGHPIKIQVEADTLDLFRQALAAGADAVLLDNMSLDDLRLACLEGKGRILLEASGGIELTNVREVALTGVDVISVGRLTHSAPALDLGLDVG